MTIAIELNDSVLIGLDGRITTSGSACLAYISFEVIGQTEKAWKVQAVTETGKQIDAWLPKKALVSVKESKNYIQGDNQRHVIASIARWFRPTGWTATFLRLATENTIIRAA